MPKRAIMVSTLIFARNCSCVSRVSYQLDSLSSQCHQCCVVLLFFSHLIAMCNDTSVVLICIFSMANGVGHLLMCLFACCLYIFLSEILFMSFAYFRIRLFSFLLSFESSLYILYTCHCQVHGCLNF